MTQDIENNKRYYALFIALAEASQTLPIIHLGILKNLNNYDFQINGYKVELSISEQPKWPTQLKGEVDSEKIYQAVKKNNYQVKLSYLMRDHHWLNYHEILYLTPYKLTLILLLAELILIGMLLFYTWSIYRLKFPLEKLKSSAERLGLDFKSSPLQETGTGLVRETSRAINLMQERIQELIRTRTQLLATISHDLRTPITRLQLRAQLLDDDDLAEKIIRDLNEMQSMIGGVLSFARNDVFNEKKIKLDLISLVSTVADDFVDLGHHLEFTANVNFCNIYGRPIALRRCISNVVQNASKYGQHILITVKRTKQEIEITVQDDGPGIPENELEQVWKPFYRSESSRHQFSTGTGLGLTVTLEVVKDHHGKVVLTNIKPSGLQVVITLPINLKKF